MPKDRVNPTEVLPNEITLKIFNTLGVSDLDQAAEVNRYWYQLTTDPLIWSRKAKHNFRKKITPDRYAKVEYKELERRTYGSYHKFEIDFIRAFKAYDFPALKKLFAQQDIQQKLPALLFQLQSYLTQSHFQFFVDNNVDLQDWILGWLINRANLDTLELIYQDNAHLLNIPPLHMAASRGDTEAFQQLLNDTTDINHASVVLADTTALHFACGKGKLDIVKALLQKGADVDATDARGWSAIHFACYNNRERVVEVLMQRSANLLAVGAAPVIEDGLIVCTPADIAAHEGHLKVLKMLMTKVSASDMPNSLYFAAKNGHVDVGWVLIQHGVPITQKDLIKAAKHGQAEFLEMLLEHKPNINFVEASGKSPLSEAAKYGHLDVVELLCENGAYINIHDLVDDDGRVVNANPLDIAFRYSHNRVAEYLLANGAKLYDDPIREPYANYEITHPWQIRLTLKYQACKLERLNSFQGSEFYEYMSFLESRLEIERAEKNFSRGDIVLAKQYLVKSAYKCRQIFSDYVVQVVCSNYTDEFQYTDESMSCLLDVVKEQCREDKELIEVLSEGVSEEDVSTDAGKKLIEILDKAAHAHEHGLYTNPLYMRYCR